MAIKTYTIKNKQGEVLGELHFDPLSEITIIAYRTMFIDIKDMLAPLKDININAKGEAETITEAATLQVVEDVLTLRFIENLSWKEVAYTAGAGNTEDSVKKRCYRYLKGSEDDEQKKGATTEV